MGKWMRYNPQYGPKWTFQNVGENEGDVIAADFRLMIISSTFRFSFFEHGDIFSRSQYDRILSCDSEKKSRVSSLKPFNVNFLYKSYFWLTLLSSFCHKMLDPFPIPVTSCMDDTRSNSSITFELISLSNVMSFELFPPSRVVYLNASVQQKCDYVWRSSRIKRIPGGNAIKDFVRKIQT
jgi:hypothetical protein